MWSYYGTKKSIASHYPKPLYDTIVESFCGAAQYSLYGDNWAKNVILVDKYPVVTGVWNYLINSSKEDILKLPDLNVGDNVDDFKQLIDEEKWLIGFCINPASAMPKKTSRPRSRWNKNKIEIANTLYKIKHWKVVTGEYNCVGNLEATWYIDPPYQYGGIYYRMNNKHINYAELGEWCKSRNGQVIVCENTKADWLEFKPLVELHGQLHKTTEAIWYKEDEKWETQQKDGSTVDIAGLTDGSINSGLLGTALDVETVDNGY